MLYLAVIGLFFLGPRPDLFVNHVVAGDYANLLEQLLPSEHWFEGLQTKLDSVSRI
jgi:hypothetical protein